MEEREEKKMQLWEHLEELRITLFKIIGAITCTTIVSFYFVQQLYDALMRPVSLLQQAHPEFQVKVIYSGPFDPVFVVMKIAFLGGILLGFPLVMLFLWSFIAPALKKREHHAFFWICGTGSFSFAAGVTLGYFSVAPILNILTGFGMQGADNFWKIGDFISFMLYWLLCTGMIFELPLVIVILTKIGVVEIALLKRIRPFVFIGSMIFAAIITPPDPITMAMIGGPLVLLYELGILIAALGQRRNRASSGGEDDPLLENSD
jgi:sec-independent protein translocase protein TatC